MANFVDYDGKHWYAFPPNRTPRDDPAESPLGDVGRFCVAAQGMAVVEKQVGHLGEPVLGEAQTAWDSDLRQFMTADVQQTGDGPAAYLRRGGGLVVVYSEACAVSYVTNWVD